MLREAVAENGMGFATKPQLIVSDAANNRKQDWGAALPMPGISVPEEVSVSHRPGLELATQE
ncbi:hypothetical protein CHELA1G11_40008 [Hyphomicrobiales bacterium]|nr:hypothetical protein CHELA1G11_40008 [Hyphomicrobiales bacterium]CAH1696572.1 hypothetical protein CHELA1G2_40133 [Hyphomicrobiales bacterium]